jgi:hypothetical protein
MCSKIKMSFRNLQEGMAIGCGSGCCDGDEALVDGRGRGGGGYDGSGGFDKFNGGDADVGRDGEYFAFFTPLPPSPPPPPPPPPLMIPTSLSSCEGDLSNVPPPPPPPPLMILPSSSESGV